MAQHKPWANVSLWMQFLCPSSSHVMNQIWAVDKPVWLPLNLQPCFWISKRATKKKIGERCASFLIWQLLNLVPTEKLKVLHQNPNVCTVFFEPEWKVIWNVRKTCPCSVTFHCPFLEKQKQQTQKLPLHLCWVTCKVVTKFVAVLQPTLNQSTGFVGNAPFQENNAAI